MPTDDPREAALAAFVRDPVAVADFLANARKVRRREGYMVPTGDFFKLLQLYETREAQRDDLGRGLTWALLTVRGRWRDITETMTLSLSRACDILRKWNGGNDPSYRAMIWPPEADGEVDLSRLTQPTRDRIEVLESRLADREAQLAALQNAIRLHRDQRGDDRCWLDDQTLYAVLPEGSAKTDLRLHTPEEMLANCKRFITSRQPDGQPYVSPQREIERLEAQLVTVQERLDDALETIALGNDPKFVDQVWAAQVEALEAQLAEAQQKLKHPDDACPSYISAAMKVDALESQLLAVTQVLGEVRALVEEMRTQCADDNWHPMYRNALVKFGGKLAALLSTLPEQP